MLPYWLAAAVTALFSVLYAHVFRFSEELSFSWVHQNAAWAFVLTPLAMLASTLMAHYFAPTASGSGIPQLLAAVEISHKPHPFVDKILGWRMIAMRFFGLCICVAGGGVTGREGPMLQSMILAGGAAACRSRWPKLQPSTLGPGWHGRFSNRRHAHTVYVSNFSSGNDRHA